MFECQSWSVSHSAGIQLDRHPAALLMSCLWCISCSICLCYCCCCKTFVCPIIMSFWCSTRTVSLKCIPNGIEGGKFNQNQLYSHSLLLFRFEFDEWAHGMASPAHNSLYLVSSRTHERINLSLWSPYTFSVGTSCLQILDICGTKQSLPTAICDHFNLMLVGR